MKDIEKESAWLSRLRDKLEQALLKSSSDTRINGDATSRLPSAGMGI